MKTFEKMLIVLGLFVFAYNASMMVHEAGHALTLMATGGKVDSIEISPLSWSYTHHGYNPEPMATTWSGFLAEAMFGMAALGLLWAGKSRMSVVGVMLAIMGVAGAGEYMLDGAIGRFGDSGTLILMGISPTVLMAIGAGLIAAAVPMVVPLGSLLGVGRGKTKFRVTMLVFSPALAYLLVAMVFNLWKNPHDWLMWVEGVVSGTIFVGIIHWSAPWGEGPETQRREMPVNWWTCGVSLILGAGVIIGGLAAFPVRTSASEKPKAEAKTIEKEMAKERAEMKVLVDMDSLKAIATKDFPKNLQCTITVGPRWNPSDSLSYVTFSTFGENGEFKRVTASIPKGSEVGTSTSLGWARTSREGQPYCLEWFSYDKDGVVFLRDLNIDGEWDVKWKQNAAARGQYIRLGKEWIQVDKTSGLMDELPTATKGGENYEFRGSWALVTAMKAVGEK